MHNSVLGRFGNMRRKQFAIPGRVLMQNSYERHNCHSAHFSNMRKANCLQPFVCNAHNGFFASFANIRRKRVAISARPGMQIIYFAISPLQKNMFFSLDTFFCAVGTETFFCLTRFFSELARKLFSKNTKKKLAHAKKCATLRA